MEIQTARYIPRNQPHLLQLPIATMRIETVVLEYLSFPLLGLDRMSLPSTSISRNHRLHRQNLALQR